MILIPRGSFWMGSEGRYSWESPRHRVFVSAFRIAPTAVTRREYQTFLEATRHPEPMGWSNPEFAHADQPAVGMSWFDAVAYCEWISETCRAISEMILTSGSPEGSVIEAVPNFITRIGFDTLVI